MNFLETDMNVWQSRLSALSDVVDCVHTNWPAQGELNDVLARVVGALPDDVEKCQKGAGAIFGPESENDSQTAHNFEVIRQWHYAGSAPSLMAMCVCAFEHFDLNVPKRFRQAVFMAALLGEVENTNPYHNNLHFKKVLLQTVRMIAAHNEIFKETSQELADGSIALLLLTACIHDLGHDGKGNVVQGSFFQGRLEGRSFEFAKPYFEACGMDHSQFLDDVRTMLLGTDTTPMGEPSSPVNQMKAAYRYHYMGEKNKVYTLNLDLELQALEGDKRLALLSLILHEADIATSAGLDYRITKFETKSLMQEAGREEAYPEQVLDFLNHVCNRAFLSHAGQRLYAANMARIYVLAEDDVRGGNLPFPNLEHSDLMVSVISETQGSTSVN